MGVSSVIEPISNRFYHNVLGLSQPDAAIAQVDEALNDVKLDAAEMSDSWPQTYRGEMPSSDESGRYKMNLMTLAGSVRTEEGKMGSVIAPTEADRAFRIACRVTFAAGLAGTLDAIGLCQEGDAPRMAFAASGQVTHTELARALNHRASEELPRLHWQFASVDADDWNKGTDFYRTQPLKELHNIADALASGCTEKEYFSRLSFAAETAYIGGVRNGLDACRSTQDEWREPTGFSPDFGWAFTGFVDKP